MTEEAPASLVAGASATSNPQQKVDSRRQELIDTAIRFLQNPKVMPTQLENKRQFLIKKGLTLEEVEIALKNSGSYNVPLNLQHSLMPVHPQELINQSSRSLMQNSIWFRIAKWLASFIAAGCIAFTAYKLMIKKYFSNKKSKVEKQLEAVVSTNNKLNESLKEMQNTIESLRQSLEQMTKEMSQTNRDKLSKACINETEIRSELQSVKSLLLNRSQFPSIPTVTPIIPSWQLNSRKDDLKINGTGVSSGESDDGEKKD